MSLSFLWPGLSVKKLNKTIYKLDPNTKKILKTYNSVREVSKELNIGETWMGQICIKEKIYKGYLWKQKKY